MGKYSSPSNIPGSVADTDDSGSLGEFFSFLWRLRYWILMSVITMVGGTYIVLEFISPVYQRSAQIMLSTTDNGNKEMAVLSEIAGMGEASSLDNEIYILRSKTLMTRVVESLNLNYRYFTEYVPGDGNQWNGLKRLFSFGMTEYYRDSPFSIELKFNPLYSEKSQPLSLKVVFIPVDDRTYRLKEIITSPETEVAFDGRKVYGYGDPFSLGGLSFSINAVIPSDLHPGVEYAAVWRRPELTADVYSEKLTANVEKGISSKLKTSDVITLSIRETNTERAEDVLNTLIERYNEEAREYKNISVVKTIEFIDSRLKVLSDELDNVESSYRNYQSSRTLVNIEAQSQLALSSDMSYENQLTEIRLQNSILDMIREEMNKMGGGEYRVLPSNIGLNDVNLSGVISNYNLLVAERSMLVANSSEGNPRVLSLNQQLSDARNSIFVSIDNLEKVYRIREKELNEVLKKSKQMMSSIPGQQFDLTQIARKQQILEPLYLLLQQKKEEAQISQYSVADKARVIEKVGGSMIPVSPKSNQILFLMFIFGFCLPPGYIMLRRVLKTKVESRDDIENVLTEPVLATIPYMKEASVIRKFSSRDGVTESFRMLRSNLKFLKDAKVIQVTSSVSGEGKSFVASNLAVSVAHMGKKVALLGLDLRKPSLHNFFEGIEADKKNCLITYLIGKSDDLSKTVSACPFCENLHIAFSGIIPPNPTELLSLDRLNEMIEWFGERYDYVIIDSAPMMLVSDSLLINKLVDYTIYVIRSEYTRLTLLPEIKNLFERDEIKSPKIVLNSIDFDSKSIKYGYGYGYGYNYGYNYGYAYGYGNSDLKKTENP